MKKAASQIGCRKTPTATSCQLHAMSILISEHKKSWRAASDMFLLLRAAGSSSHELQPFFTDGPFLSNALVQHHVAERQNLDVNLLTPACAYFQAVGSLGRRSKFLTSWAWLL